MQWKRQRDISELLIELVLAACELLKYAWRQLLWLHAELFHSDVVLLIGEMTVFLVFLYHINIPVQHMNAILGQTKAC